MSKFLMITLCCFFLLQSSFVFAFETDQFNLPPAPLADIGDELTEYTRENLEKAVAKINSEIAWRQICADSSQVSPKNLKCDSAAKNATRLKFLRSPDAPAEELYKLVGTGIPPFTSSGTWMEKHTFKNQPARHKPGYKDSIYFLFPINYIGLSSTVNLYGAEFGTDKIAHLYQQGYSYYKIYRKELNIGKSEAEATRAAVKWGQKTERTYYGTLLTGVYSNGDLSANYAGLKFYLGLTEEIRIGDYIHPPILILDKDGWKFNKKVNLQKSLVEPFISEHFSEALNPSIYSLRLTLNAYARKTLRRNCSRWLEKFPGRTQADFAELSNSLRLWNGENYGFKESDKFITIANTCFANKNSAPNAD